MGNFSIMLFALFILSGCFSQRDKSEDIEKVKVDPSAFLIGEWFLDSTDNSAHNPEKTYHSGLFRPVSQSSYKKLKAAFYFNCDSIFNYQAGGKSIMQIGANTLEMSMNYVGECVFLDTTYHVKQSDLRGYDCQGVLQYTNKHNERTYYVPIMEKTDTTMVIYVVSEYLTSDNDPTGLFFQTGTNLNGETLYLKKESKGRKEL